VRRHQDEPVFKGFEGAFEFLRATVPAIDPGAGWRRAIVAPRPTPEAVAYAKLAVLIADFGE
jgi:hypothetical protein